MTTRLNETFGKVLIDGKLSCHQDPLLGNDRETKNETTAITRNSFVNTHSTGAVARHRPARNNGSTVGSGVFCESVPGLYHSNYRV
jgi:hypothetical protein